MNLVVVIPAYNESKSIADVLSRLPRRLPGVNSITPIVVDDNSSDATRAIALANGARCVSHAINLGAGGATITGLEAARRLDADICITLDADGQHDPGDIPRVIEPILRQSVDVVLTSRLKQGASAMPPLKRVGNRLLNLVTFVFYRIWVSDSQSGFKAFSRRGLATIDLRSIGYEYCSAVVGEIRHKRLRYCEVPIKTIYTTYSKSKGQMALNAVNIVVGLVLRHIR